MSGDLNINLGALDGFDTTAAINDLPIKNIKNMSLYWKVYIKKKVIWVSARVGSHKIFAPNWWTTTLYQHDYNITTQID